MAGLTTGHRVLSLNNGAIMKNVDFPSRKFSLGNVIYDPYVFEILDADTVTEFLRKHVCCDRQMSKKSVRTVYEKIAFKTSQGTIISNFELDRPGDNKIVIITDPRRRVTEVIVDILPF